MEYLRRNIMTLVVGRAAIIVLASVITGALFVIVDRDLGDDESVRESRVESMQVDLSRLSEALSDFRLADVDFEHIQEFRDSIRALGIDRMIRSFVVDLMDESIAPDNRRIVLGVSVEQNGEEIFVRRVLPGSSAESAGLKVGDKILSVGGANVRSVEALKEALSVTDGTASFEVLIDRDDDLMRLTVEPGSFVISQSRNPMLRGIRSTSRYGPQAFEAPVGKLGGKSDHRLQARERPGEKRDGQSDHRLQADDRDDGVMPRDQGEEGRFKSTFPSRERLFPGVNLAKIGKGHEVVKQRLRLARLGWLISGILPENLATELGMSERRLVGGAATSVKPVENQESGFMSYFGRVSAIDGATVTLTGAKGPITLELAAATVNLGSAPAVIGDLVTAVTRDGIVEFLIVVT